MYVATFNNLETEVPSVRLQTSVCCCLRRPLVGCEKDRIEDSLHYGTSILFYYSQSPFHSKTFYYVLVVLKIVVIRAVRRYVD
jgi:hypothetical protein